MKQQSQTVRVIPIEKYSTQWKLSQSIGNYAARLNQMPDAAEAIKQKRRSAPHYLLPMLF